MCGFSAGVVRMAIKRGAAYCRFTATRFRPVCPGVVALPTETFLASKTSISTGLFGTAGSVKSSTARADRASRYAVLGATRDAAVALAGSMRPCSRAAMSSRM